MDHCHIVKLKRKPIMKDVLRVAVTGGAGQICYNLLYRIGSGEMFGKDQPVALHILELPQGLKSLHGVALELMDCAFPLLREIKVGDRAEEVFDGVDYAVLVGARPRGKGMERADLLQENAKIFVSQAKAFTNPNVKVLVVGNPCNTNALVLLHNGPNLKPENVRAMMRLDQNRATAQLSQKAKVPVRDVSHVAVYGNHSPTMVVDYQNAKIGGKPAVEVIGDMSWLQGEMMTTVQKRGAEIIEARGLSSAASAANAAIDAIRDWHFPTEGNNWYSAAMYSTGNPYSIAEDIFFSFPVSHNKIVAGLKVDSFLEEKIKLTEKELLSEREAVKQYLG